MHCRISGSWEQSGQSVSAKKQGELRVEVRSCSEERHLSPGRAGCALAPRSAVMAAVLLRQSAPSLGIYCHKLPFLRTRLFVHGNVRTLVKQGSGKVSVENESLPMQEARPLLQTSHESGMKKGW